MSVVGLAEVTCLHCARRLRDVGTMRADGRIRCAKCQGLTYFIPAPMAGYAILVTVTAAELAAAQRDELTLAQFLDRLGLARPFIPTPLLAPERVA